MSAADHAPQRARAQLLSLAESAASPQASGFESFAALAAPEDSRPAAVLMLFGVLDSLAGSRDAQADAVSRDLDLLLLARASTLRSHPGQVAFPGGRVDPGDDGPIAAALREAEEEIGLPPDRVEIVGIADVYRTITGFEVTPVVGIVPPDLPLSPHPGEVAAMFEAPLHYLLDPSHQHVRSASWRGQERHYYEIDYEGRRIWGATAAMIVNLSRRLVLA